jgi:hypothetical protein
MGKYETILNNTWEYLENNYKGSEITMKMWLKLVEKESDTKNCLKKCIKILWDEWEFFYNEERQFYKKYIKDNYHVIVK